MRKKVFNRFHIFVLQGSAEALGKFTPEIMSSLQGYLSQLGISLTDILLDPGIFIELYSDPEKAKILSKVQDILPEFSARELNDLLSVKLEIDDRVPNADKIMKIMFSLPFSATGKVRIGFFKTSLNQFNSREGQHFYSIVLLYCYSFLSLTSNQKNWRSWNRCLKKFWEPTT